MRIKSLRDLDWLTVAQAGQLLQMSPSAIRTKIKEGKIKSFRDGKIFRISRESLDEYIQNGCSGMYN